MKTTSFAATIAILATAVTASPVPQQGGGFDPNLVPDFGVQRGASPDGTGNCVGNKGKLIPCFCPPERGAFIGAVQNAVAQGNVFGTPVSFPTDNSPASQRARLNTAILVTQNFNGTKGVGCPVVATTYLDQLAAIQG